MESSRVCRVRLLDTEDGMIKVFAKVAQAVGIPTALFGRPEDHDISNVLHWLSHVWAWHVEYTRIRNTPADRSSSTQWLTFVEDGYDFSDKKTVSVSLTSSSSSASTSCIHVECSLLTNHSHTVAYTLHEETLPRLLSYHVIARLMRYKGECFSLHHLHHEPSIGIHCQSSSLSSTMESKEVVSRPPLLSTRASPTHKKTSMLDPFWNVNATLFGYMVAGPLEWERHAESAQARQQQVLAIVKHPTLRWERWILCERLLAICVTHLLGDEDGWYDQVYTYAHRLSTILTKRLKRTWQWTEWVVEYWRILHIKKRTLLLDDKQGPSSTHQWCKSLVAVASKFDEIEDAYRQLDGHFKRGREIVMNERERRHILVCRNICGFGIWYEWTCCLWTCGFHAQAHYTLGLLLTAHREEEERRIPKDEYPRILETLEQMSPPSLSWWWMPLERHWREERLAHTRTCVAAINGQQRHQRKMVSFSDPPKGYKVAIWCRLNNPAGESWDLDSVRTTGIGGSEEAVIYMAEALARAGCCVTVYGFPVACSRGQLPGANPRLVSSASLFHTRSTSSSPMYDVLVSWRDPGLDILQPFAKRLVLWLHDTTSAHVSSRGETQSQEIARHARSLPSFAGILLLSEFHRRCFFPLAAVPCLPDTSRRRVMKRIQRLFNWRSTVASSRDPPLVLAAPPPLYSRLSPPITGRFGSALDSVPERLIVLTSNGIDTGQFYTSSSAASFPSTRLSSGSCRFPICSVDHEDNKDKNQRIPFRCLYASNYRRGLSVLLKLWPAIKKRFPQATLDVYFGWPPYDPQNEWMMQQFRALHPLGVREHGRVHHWELARAMQQAEFWTYPCTFDETFCTVAIKAQAAGLIPVVIRRAALVETVFGGYTCEREEDYLELVCLALSERHDRVQAQWRSRLSSHILQHYSWDHVARTWIQWFHQLFSSSSSSSSSSSTACCRISPPFSSFGFRSI